MNERAFMIPADRYELSGLLAEWAWLVPESDTPLFLTVMADWVFGAPDGSIWRLSALEGDYVRIAANAAEYNALKGTPQWLNKAFCADWQPIAAGNNLLPNDMECLGWRRHPYLGGELKAGNLQVFSMLTYQSLMGQLHRQLQPRSGAESEKSSG
ncbi:hypothetical protein ACEN9F_03670 [Duganella sp. CT11-25]|uniref:hypothetical protein n=1 Tax=unclassified Duganella TaxID=2636909 RepID=UPI0039B0B731